MIVSLFWPLETIYIPNTIDKVPFVHLVGNLKKRFFFLQFVNAFSNKNEMLKCQKSAF